MINFESVQGLLYSGCAIYLFYLSLLTLFFYIICPHIIVSTHFNFFPFDWKNTNLFVCEVAYVIQKEPWILHKKTNFQNHSQSYS